MDDTIYREAAVKHLKHRLYETAMNNDDLAGVFSEIADNRIETWIEELPSARPETTRKILASSRGGITMWYKCEKCGQAADQSDNYCRCCGRRFLNG